MKILILVLSYNEPPYRELMQAQQATWDAVEVEGVRTVYYHGGELIDMNKRLPYYDTIYDCPNKSSTQIGFQCTDEYYYMAAKFKKALEYVADFDYDIIFRTNSSSYVNKQRLKEFAATLPTEKLYAGWTFPDSNSEDKGMCVSGAGIFLSRDTAEILRDEIDPQFEMEEDVYCGRILRKHGIVPIDDRSRVDYPQQQWKDLKKPYHIRFKTEDRIKDAENMKLVHQKILQ